MGIASSIAPFALVVFLGLSGIYASAQTEAVTSLKKSDNAKFHYSLGMTYWQEQLQMSGPAQQYYKVSAANWALALGLERRHSLGKWGWQFEIEALAGQSESESTDPSVIYLQNHESIFGGETAVGTFYAFAPHLLISSQAGLMFRHIDLSTPSGFSLENFADTYDAMVRLEMSFPLPPRAELIERISYAFINRDIIWFLGIRI